jgi:predicted Zn-dependent peptidase
MNLLACFTLFDGEPHLVNTILDEFLAVTRDELLSVANKYLRNENRAIVFRVPTRTMPEGSDLMAASGGVGN